MYRAVKCFLGVAAFTLLSTSAFAQGTLTGTVRDASGAVLPGVTVEAASPALIEKVRSVVTDGTGQYRVIDLNPGTYSLTFALPGFSTVKREGIEITGTAVLTIPIEMRVGALEETITVTGETPVVDVQSTKRETVLSQEVISAIPATRAVGSLLNATPGLTVDGNGLAATPTMTFFSARGGQTNEGRMAVNGMTVAAAFNGGGVSSYILDSVNVDEVAVVVSGGLGESDIGGPTMNLVPSSGGNAFRGQGFINNAGEWSKGSNLDDSLRAVGIVDPPGIIGAYDASVSYGGPIKRDRLWFFGSYRKLDTSTTVEGIVANANAYNASSWRWAPDDSLAARQLQGRTMYIGRLTAQATQKNRFTFGHEYQLRCEGAPLKVETDGCHSRSARLDSRNQRDHLARGRDQLLRFPVLPDAGNLVGADDEQAAARGRLFALLVLPCGRPGPVAAGRDLRPDLGDGAVDGDRSGYRHPLFTARELWVPRGPDLQRQLRQPEQLARLGVVRDRRAQHEGRLSGKLAHCQVEGRDTRVARAVSVQPRSTECVLVPPAGLANDR